MDFAFTREQLLFKKEVLAFARKEIVPRVRDHDLKGEFDFESFRKMGDFGILGLHFPESLGGGGADVVTTVLAGEALGEAGVDGGLTLAYGAHSFLCADTIFCHSTEEQRKKYIPRLASGEWIGCMGVSEPDAGSDVASLRTTAEKRGDKYVLNGVKMWITNGPIADVAVIYAKTHKSGGKPIIAYQEVAFKLSEMLTLQQTSQLFAYRTAWTLETSPKEAESLMWCAKVFCTEAAEKVSGYSLQILAGSGFISGNPSETAYRCAKYGQIAGTSTEISRVKIGDAALGYR